MNQGVPIIFVIGVTLLGGVILNIIFFRTIKDKGKRVVILIVSVIGLGVLAYYEYDYLTEKEVESTIPLEITVDDDFHQCRNANYKSIQEAINNAKNGDTIKVYKGYYRERLLIDKKLTLIGIDAPILLPTGENREMIVVGVDKCIIKGFDLLGEGNTSHGIRVISNENQIINNTCCGCTWGIYIKGEDNKLLDNELGNAQEGILLFNSSNSTISGNKFENNDWGISLYESHSNTISKNIFKSNDQAGIIMQYSYTNIISENYFEDSFYGIYLYENCYDNEIYNNKFKNITFFDIFEKKNNTN